MSSNPSYQANLLEIPDLATAKKWDQLDPLSKFRDEFEFPVLKNGKAPLYFTGHSLGLMPKRTRRAIEAHLNDWSQFGVEGHFKGSDPWLPIHETLTPSLARLVGARENEVVAMNTLTVNLHLMLVSFYRPRKGRSKILIEANTFPSDKYAVDSQVRFHGFHPEEDVLSLRTGSDGYTLTDDELIEQLEQHRNELALILLGQCNYLSGQRFPIERIAKWAQKNEIPFGLNLAHGAGNLELSLHEWGVDFAVWCSYKYLNSGPGGLAAAFVHERHLGRTDLPRFHGWWGQDKKSRFQMGPEFQPIPTVEAWQLSNPPVLQAVALRSSLEIFSEAGMMGPLRQRGDRLTGALESSVRKRLDGLLEVVTPKSRGSMLCMKFGRNLSETPRKLAHQLIDSGIWIDFREPNIIRAAPQPLYNNFQDVYSLVDQLSEVLK